MYYTVEYDDMDSLNEALEQEHQDREDIGWRYAVAQTRSAGEMARPDDGEWVGFGEPWVSEEAWNE